MEMTTRVRPILKWAGGKQALAMFLVDQFPSEFDRFYEPFVGGGSVFLELQPSRAVIGDLNHWLLDTYKAIRDDNRRVAMILDGLRNTKEEFLRIRQIQPETVDLFERAAYLIYLNKTCFRGLFRVNRKGAFNVPYGAYDRRYYNPENLRAFSRRLRKVDIRPSDFELTLHDIAENDFVYFDPPYYKEGGYSDFNRFTAAQFRENDHIRLAVLCRELDSRNIHWALSNSDTPFVRFLYKGFKFVSVNSRREINLASKKRNSSEVLVTNF